ncbi:MAG TPA: hypothetical protein PKA00_20885 [Saprospiraceae bacterium]|nr:hypothetical protein [Saprospiraceae bacterium]HMQ85379.1 hypothetical protein [Saprospiraceae bacterium]
MLIVLIHWLYLSGLSLVWGFAGMNSLHKLMHFPLQHPLSPLWLVLVGLSLQTAFAGCLSLIMPLSLLAETLVIGLGLMASALYWKDLKSYMAFYFGKWVQLPWAFHLASLALLFIALLKAAGPIEIPDDGEYFLPLIRWIETYAVVPGTALVHDRMGYNAAFHLICALFGQRFLLETGLYDLNGLLFIWLNAWFLSGLLNLWQKPLARFSLLPFIKIGGMLFFFRDLLSSADSDYVYIFAGIALLVLAVKKYQDSTFFQWDNRWTAYFVIALFLTTCKIIAAFYLFVLIPAFLLLLSRRNWLHAASLTAVALFCLLPWFLRNYYLSGYLIYPLFGIDLFQPDWKVPREVAQGNLVYIAEHAKTQIVRYEYAYAQAQELKWPVWLPLWIQHTQETLMGKICLWGWPMALVIIAIKGISNWKIWSKKIDLLWLAFITLGFVSYWFFNFPALRFAWPWLLLGFALATAILESVFIAQFGGHGRRIIAIGATILLTLLLGRGLVHSVLENPDWKAYWLFPCPPTELQAFETKGLGKGVQLIISQDESCWGALPPCMPAYWNSNLELRGASIQDGFRLKTAGHE